jgi:hypothetical protein
MLRSVSLFFGVALLFSFAHSAKGVDTVAVIPSDDGDIHQELRVRTNFYVSPDGFDQGIVEFPLTRIDGPILTATLGMELYGWPPGSQVVQVFGYPSEDGLVTSADYGAGTYLGNLTMNFQTDPLGFEKPFDVASFIKTLHTPFVGFNFRTEEGLVIFSSLEHNYSHPSILTVTMIPEAGSLALAVVAAATATASCRREKRCGRRSRVS